MTEDDAGQSACLGEEGLGGMKQICGWSGKARYGKAPVSHERKLDGSLEGKFSLYLK